MLLNDRQSQFYFYTSRLNKHRKDFLYASRVIKSELSEALHRKDFNSKSKKFFSLTKTLTNSSIWISRTSLKYLKSYLDLKAYHNENLKDPRSKLILQAVKAKKACAPSLQVKDQEIFRIIYQELMYAHFNLNSEDVFGYKKDLSKTTIVLISGVFNEIFSTPAFKRGADYLKENYQLENISINVSGVKDSVSNAEIIKKELEDYVAKNPKQNLWIVSFSKGGLDTLHFLKDSEALDEKIKGVSFIACPILGSEHVNHKLVKALSTTSLMVNKVAKNNSIIPMALEMQKSLDAKFRTNWFRVNHKKLPQHAFYTAIALESKWYQSHIWMILTKAFFMSGKSNDGIVDTDRAQFPQYFKGLNLGVLEGHHLIGSRSSFYNQEALLEAHLLFLLYKKLI